MGRKATLKFEYKGELMTVSELMPYSLVDRSTLRDRLIKLRWPVNKALIQKTQRQVNGNIPSKASVSANEAKRSRKTKEFKLFAQCTARCNAK